MSLSYEEVVSELLGTALEFARDHNVPDIAVASLFNELIWGDEPEEEPPVTEHDPGLEVDDKGGMSEYRHGIESEEPRDRYVSDPEWTPGWPPMSSEDM